MISTLFRFHRLQPGGVFCCGVLILTMDSHPQAYCELGNMSWLRSVAFWSRFYFGIGGCVVGFTVEGLCISLRFCCMVIPISHPS